MTMYRIAWTPVDKLQRGDRLTSPSSYGSRRSVYRGTIHHAVTTPTVVSVERRERTPGAGRDVTYIVTLEHAHGVRTSCEYRWTAQLPVVQHALDGIEASPPSHNVDTH